MAKTILTSKVATKGGSVLNLPTTDKATTSTSYVEISLGETLNIDIPDNMNYFLGWAVYSGNGAHLAYFQIRDSDGATVLESFRTSSNSQTVSTTGIRKHNDSKYDNKTGLRVFIQTTWSGTTANLKQNSIRYFYAPNRNISNIQGTKMMISNIYMITSNTADGTEGQKTNKDDLDFTQIPVNALKDSIIWDNTSGDVLYDWDGSTVGLE